MKVLLVLLLATVATASLLPARLLFDRFVAEYGKHYANDAELRHRFEVFKANLKLAAARSAEDGSTHGITRFMDLTPEEFKTQILQAPLAPNHIAMNCLTKGVYKRSRPEITAPSPDTWDWRTVQNVVLPVRDQGSCGSCWAFSTVETLEGQNGIKKNQGMVGLPLSPQYIVDCSKGSSSEMYLGTNTTVQNGGCNGGWPWTAFDDLSSKDTISPLAGVPTDTDYPYKGITGTCKDITGKTITKVKQYNCVTARDKNYVSATTKDMKDALYNYGPLSIALNANPFQTYRNGILNPASCTTTALNHAVLLVGYGKDAASGQQYWIIKNSWGASWGEQGYVRLAISNSDPMTQPYAGVCGVNEGVSIAFVNNN
jgi:cathepsin F